jgi:hypothetical protein
MHIEHDYVKMNIFSTGDADTFKIIIDYYNYNIMNDQPIASEVIIQYRKDLEKFIEDIKKELDK